MQAAKKIWFGIIYCGKLKQPCLDASQFAGEIQFPTLPTRLEKDRTADQFWLPIHKVC
jgi:hypothetical protein